VVHADLANYVVGRIMIYDLYAIGVVVSYVAFVGAWHTWEKLTGRMEAEQQPPRPGGPGGDPGAGGDG
jgi:hypothetical protein